MLARVVNPFPLPRSHIFYEKPLLFVVFPALKIRTVSSAHLCLVASYCILLTWCWYLKGSSTGGHENADLILWPLLDFLKRLIWRIVLYCLQNTGGPWCNGTIPAIVSKLFFDKQHYGLVQDCSNSIASALELLQSCTKPSILIITMSPLVKIKIHMVFHKDWYQYRYISVVYSLSMQCVLNIYLYWWL